MPEGRVPGEAPGQEISCCCELLADEAEPQEPCSHRVFRVFILLRLCARPSDVLGHLGKREAKLNVAFQLSGVDAVLPFAVRAVELEESELDGAFGECCVVVQHVVSAVIVMLASSVVCVVRVVPDLRKVCHVLRLSSVQSFKESRVDRSAVMPDPAFVKLQGFRDQAFVACHDVGEVLERLCCMAACADVDVDAAAS